jgi:hypothetical protein
MLIVSFPSENLEQPAPLFSVLNPVPEEQGGGAFQKAGSAGAFPKTGSAGAFPKTESAGAFQKIGMDAAGLYRQAISAGPAGRARLNAAQQARLDQVADLPRWQATLAHWQEHGWNPRNLPGLLDLYGRGGPAACRSCGGPQAAGSTPRFAGHRGAEKRDGVTLWIKPLICANRG